MKNIIRLLYLIVKSKLTKKRLEFMKCDAKGCAWIEVHEELTVEHVDTPCPLCGQPLMSEKEYLDFTAQRDSRERSGQ